MWGVEGSKQGATPPPALCASAGGEQCRRRPAWAPWWQLHHPARSLKLNRTPSLASVCFIADRRHPGCGRPHGAQCSHAAARLLGQGALNRSTQSTCWPAARPAGVMQRRSRRRRRGRHARLQRQTCAAGAITRRRRLLAAGCRLLCCSGLLPQQLSVLNTQALGLVLAYLLHFVLLQSQPACHSGAKTLFRNSSQFTCPTQNALECVILLLPPATFCLHARLPSVLAQCCLPAASGRA